MTDGAFMAQALAQAQGALGAGEVPVGAVVVRAGQVIAVGSNAPIGTHDPSAHAEIVALRAAAQFLGNYRLEDCEMFVTLEPCAMCAGAMLHARLSRVVFGAPDPRAGAAGSVLDLFANRQLNHQTHVQGGVRAAECAALLQDFFQGKRAAKRSSTESLRDDALRTPQARFENLADYPWRPRYLSDLPSLNGLRMHYLDEGMADTGSSYLCLHGATSWSYFFRHIIAELLCAGHRVVAPDLIGFGKSDKPKRAHLHTLDWHLCTLNELVGRLDLRGVVLVLQDEIDALGAALPNRAADRYTGQVVIIETEAAELSCSAYEAPFPDQGHRAALCTTWRGPF